eukprot:790817-Amorphochlora_amoeboformis.AAC.1
MLWLQMRAGKEREERKRLREIEKKESEKRKGLREFDSWEDGREHSTARRDLRFFCWYSA